MSFINQDYLIFQTQANTFANDLIDYVVVGDEEDVALGDARFHRFIAAEDLLLA